MNLFINSKVNLPVLPHWASSHPENAKHFPASCPKTVLNHVKVRISTWFIIVKYFFPLTPFSLKIHG